jgi:nucleotide-binding universal stress UspA family protein
MFERLLIALDGSEHDRKALNAAKELAKLAEATVRVVHVREGNIIGRAGFVAREEHDEASKLVDAADLDEPVVLGHPLATGRGAALQLPAA